MGVLAGMFMGIFIVVCGEHAHKCPMLTPSCASATGPFRPHHCGGTSHRHHHPPYPLKGSSQPYWVPHADETSASVTMNSGGKNVQGKAEVHATTMKDSNLKTDFLAVNATNVKAAF